MGLKVDKEKAIRLMNFKNSHQQLFESFVDKSEMKKYEHRFNEHTLLQSDFETLNEAINQEVVDLIQNDSFDINNYSEFKKALNSGDKGEFLSDYTEDDYGKMTTYKVSGYNAGFAIKPDGDIVSLYNNSGSSGIGGELLKAAVKHGGNKMDHFDGFLTGLYSKNGFVEVSREQWNDEYAPKGWSYTPVNIFDPSTSVYVDEISKYKTKEELPEELKAAIQRYSEGKPDVIYRVLK
jgi:hypothetical protein